MSRRLPIVRVEPRGIDIEAEEGETIMAAALRAGYHWPTVCNGQGTCRVCRVEVVSRSENLRRLRLWITGSPGSPVRHRCREM